MIFPRRSAMQESLVRMTLQFLPLHGRMMVTMFQQITGHQIQLMQEQAEDLHRQLKMPQSL